MNIAIVIHGGIGVGYKQQGIPAIVNFVEKISIHHKVTVYTFTKPHSDYKPKGYALKHCSKFNFLPVIVKDHFRAKYKIIHGIWGYPGGFWATLAGKLLGVRSIVSFFGGECTHIPEINFGLALSHKKRITWLCKNASVVVTLTDFQKNILLTNFQIKRNVLVIPWGSDLQRFFYKPKKPDTVLQLINIAHLNKVKNHRMLLRVFKIIVENTDARLTIIGTDTLHGELQQLAMKLNIHDKVFFKGDVLYAEIPAYLEWSHVLVHTSLYEGQAMVVNEALATGTPVIGTRVGMISDLENDCVIAIDINDETSMISEILKLWQDKGYYDIYVKKALEYSLQNDFSKTINAYFDLYEKM